MRVLVCGGRYYEDVDKVFDTLDQIDAIYGIDCIIQGGAKGADLLARDWAEDVRVKCLAFDAEWQKYGDAAGPIRNKKMLDEGKPNLVVAFPGGKGTANMVQQAERAGVEVMKIGW